MDLPEFNPYVRFFAVRKGALPYPKMLCAFDFRLFYVAKGMIKFVFQEDCYLLTSGDIITIPPGTPYRLIFDTPSNTEYYLVNFDFRFHKPSEPVHPPVEERLFHRSKIIDNTSPSPFESVFTLRHCKNIELHFDEMQKNTDPLLRSALLKAILAKLLLQIANTHCTSGLLQKVERYIQEHIDQNPTNLSVAKHFCYHPHYLNSLFVSTKNITLHKYIATERLNRAKELLGLTDMPVSAIAQEMSFKDCSYFSAFFRKASCMTPREYRNLCR